MIERGRMEEDYGREGDRKGMKDKNGSGRKKKGNEEYCGKKGDRKRKGRKERN